MPTAERDTDTGADVQRMLFVENRLMQAADQPCAEFVDLVMAVHAIEHHHEFITTEAGNEVVLAGALTQTRGDFLQHRVAGRMAEGVVDRFEIVQIDHQQRQRRCMFLQ